jgi:hypothetical protein
MGYHQQPTKIVCENTCAVSIATYTCKLKRLKAIDMHFHWVRDSVRQNHFVDSWRPGHENLAEFFTKPLAVKKSYIYSPAATAA